MCIFFGHVRDLFSMFVGAEGFDGGHGWTGCGVVRYMPTNFIAHDGVIVQKVDVHCIFIYFYFF